MELQNSFPNGERANHSILIRLSKSQHDRLKMLSETNNYKTLSQYCRDKLLEAPSVEIKLNNILKLLQENKFKSIDRRSK